MSSRAIALVVAAILVLSSGSAHAFRCGNRIVAEYAYNFGPRKVMRRLIFEGGILVSIEALGYGYREK
jgi:hypothetical protein